MAEPVAAAAEVEANGNGNGGPVAEPVAEAPAAPLWTPPPSERWGPTGRFTRESTEDEAAPAHGPRFVRPDADAPAPEPAPATPARLLFNGPPRAADPPAPEAARPLTPWPNRPCARALSARAAATPTPRATAPDPVAPAADESWTGSWIAEPAATEPPEAVETP